MDTFQLYELVLIKANEIESELKRLGRWSSTPLPAEKFDNMGAFGENTMSFEQWLQFVLMLRISEIVQHKGSFPKKACSLLMQSNVLMATPKRMTYVSCYLTLIHLSTKNHTGKTNGSLLE